MAPAAKPPIQLQDELYFRPRWWWDPVPDWIITHLSASVIRELGMIQLEFQKDILKAQTLAIDKSIAAMKRGK